MPADFDRCVKQGGRVRTKKLSEGRYIRICFLNNKSYAGEVKTQKKSVTRGRKRSKKQKRKRK